MFDTSGYTKNHPSGTPTGLDKKVIGLMKDQANGNIISEFVGLRSELYAYKTLSGQGVKSAKVLRSRKHEITTECVTKVALSRNNYKRYVIPNDPEHKTLALGH